MSSETDIVPPCCGEGTRGSRRAGERTPRACQQERSTCGTPARKGGICCVLWLTASQEISSEKKSERKSYSEVCEMSFGVMVVCQKSSVSRVVSNQGSEV